MKRAILVHYHIYKNAGTSIDHVLKAHFKERWTAYDKAEPGALISSAELAEFIRSHPEYDALSSHQARPPIPAGDEIEVYPLFMFRHPLDRLESIYRFERSR